MFGAMTAHKSAGLAEPHAAVPTGLPIDGRWRRSSGGRVIEVLDPATGNLLTKVADGSLDDGITAVSAAKNALSSWSRPSPRQPGEILGRAFELTISQGLARLDVLDNAKTGPVEGPPRHE